MESGVVTVMSRNDVNLNSATIATSPTSTHFELGTSSTMSKSSSTIAEKDHRSSAF